MRNLPDALKDLPHRLRPGGSASHTRDRLSDLSDFGPNPGSLRARTYVPPRLPDGAPLVVVLHGCTQNAAGYDAGSGWSDVADAAGFALLFPEQQRGNNANLCFNWFLPDDIRRDGGEAASIRQMVEAVVRIHRIDRERIYVTGLSAGGAMAAVMLAAYPDVFAGGAIIAGLPYGSAIGVSQALERMRGQGGPNTGELAGLVRDAAGHRGPWPIVSVWHGSADATVNIANAEATLAQWRALHGIEGSPTHVETVGQHRRRVWRSGDGREAVESWTLAGMGHGTPLNLSGPDSCGAGAPFMLDVGLSSTCRIARFWGILDRTVTVIAVSANKQRMAEIGNPAEANPPSSDAHMHPSQLSHMSGSVGKVIEDALRKAGLMGR